MELKSVPSSLSESNRSRRSVPGSEEGVSHPAPNFHFYHAVITISKFNDTKNAKTSYSCIFVNALPA